VTEHLADLDDHVDAVGRDVADASRDIGVLVLEDVLGAGRWVAPAARTRSPS
jgi:hypothetical protein